MLSPRGNSSASARPASASRCFQVLAAHQDISGGEGSAVRMAGASASIWGADQDLSRASSEAEGPGRFFPARAHPPYLQTGAEFGQIREQPGACALGRRPPGGSSDSIRAAPASTHARGRDVGAKCLSAIGECDEGAFVSLRQTCGPQATSGKLRKAQRLLDEHERAKAPLPLGQRH